MASVEWTSDEIDWLRERAMEAGFHAAGVAPAALGSAEVSEEAQRFSAWIDAGYAGEMEYLKRRDSAGDLLRSEVRVAIPWARSVIVCALNYNADAPRSLDPAPMDSGWIARYAWSGQKPAGEGMQGPSDYHHELLKRLRLVEEALQARIPCRTSCYVDTGPLVERSAAAKAGIGWIGKNTCVIDQKLGSWLFLAVIVTSIPVSSGASLQVPADRCGSCTRCIDACPTDALVAPRMMDASRCISYLTIEKKGSIPEELRPQMGRQIFGCDICQDVCPWNRRAPVAVTPGMELRPELVNPALQWLASMEGQEFNRWFRGSPIERTRRRRMQRNIAVAMGNSGDPRFVDQLELWKREGDDAVLVETAEWALKQLEKTSASKEQILRNQ